MVKERHMKYLGVIQARCGSTRLPNKVLMELAGKPALQWTIERAKLSKYIDEVIVVTSINRENLPIVEMCCKLGIRVFSGSEEDVLDRFYQLSKLIKPEYIVRITGDCPLYDPQLLDWSIEQMANTSDFLAQKQPETFPDGLDIEVIRYSALAKSWSNASLQSEREHITQYIRKHPEIFNIQWVSCPLGDFGNERWTFDEQRDYEFLKKIYTYFSEKEIVYPYTRDIINYISSNPSLREINDTIQRDEGLKKSLENDLK